MNELKHHGIRGQRWGKRNGPPYPLDGSEHSQSEKKAGWRRSLDRNTGGFQNIGSESGTKRSGLTDRQKKALKVGAAVAITALAAYGGYRLYKSGLLDDLMKKGKRLSGEPSAVKGSPGNASPRNASHDHLSEALDKGFKKLDTQESFSERAKSVNPYQGEGGKYNCWSCGIAGYLRSKGIDVKARSSEVGLQNVKERYSTFIKDIDKHTIEDKASILCKNKDDAARTLLNRFKDNGAEGICKVNWSNDRGGHVFNWKIEDGQVKFFDYQSGRISDSFNWNGYFSQVDQNKNCYFIRLDDAEIDWETIAKTIRK